MSKGSTYSRVSTGEVQARVSFVCGSRRTLTALSRHARGCVTGCAVPYSCPDSCHSQERASSSTSITTMVAAPVSPWHRDFRALPPLRIPASSAAPYMPIVPVSCMLASDENVVRWCYCQGSSSSAFDMCGSAPDLPRRSAGRTYSTIFTLPVDSTVTPDLSRSINAADLRLHCAEADMAISLMDTVVHTMRAAPVSG